MAKVQSYPTGYLSLLGIKQGQNPGESADFVQPVVSLDTFYLASATDSERATTVGVAAEGATAAITVPSTEAWRLLAMSLNVTAVSAPMTVSASLQVIEPKTGRPVAVCPTFTYGFPAAGDSLFSGIAFPQPIVVPPGSALRAYNHFAVAGTFDLGVVALFQRFTV